MVARAREHIVQGEVVLHEAGRIGQHVVLLPLAAPGVDLGDARHRTQPRLDDPVVERGELLQGVVVAGDEVVVDLAQPGGDRAHLRAADALRQLARSAGAP